jgi:uncharacterized protein YkwD
MSRDQLTGGNHNINKGNNPFDRVEQFRYWGTNLTNQNSIYDEVTSRLSVKNLLSSSLLSKNIKIKKSMGRVAQSV